MAVEPDLLLFFKALADETRLKIVGLLADTAYSGEALAERLDLKPATVSHHLARLAEAGLVDAQMDGHAKLYRLRLDVVHGLAGRLLARETLPAAAERLLAQAEPGPSAFEAKVLRDFGSSTRRARASGCARGPRSPIRRRAWIRSST